VSSDNGFLRLPRALLRAPWFRALSPFGKALLVTMAGLANAGPGFTRRGELLQAGELVCSWSWLAERMRWRENHRLVTPSIKKIRWAAAALRRAGAISWTTTGREPGDGLIITLDFLAVPMNSHGALAGATAEPEARAPDTTAATQEVYGDPANSIDRPGLEPRLGRARVGQREGLGLPQGEERRHRGDGEEETGSAPEDGAAPPAPETPPPHGVALGLDLAGLRALLRPRRTPR